jgi:phosphoglycolate phosphatase
VIRLAVFDLDGTLVDSTLDLCQAVNHALRTVDLPERTLDEVASFIGEGAARLVERAVGAHQERFEAALAAWWDHYQRHLLDHTVLFPGIAALLAEVPFALAVHTNKPGAMARRILDGLGVLRHFVDVVGGDEAPRKPDPGGTRAILARRGVRPAESVFVGDSLVDLETARAVPARFFPVGWGLGAPEALAAASGVAVVRSAEELRAALAASSAR